MKKADARQIFKKKFAERIDTDTHYLRIVAYNNNGQDIDLPQELIKYNRSDIIVDLKQYRIINWKPEYGPKHIKLEANYMGRYELLNEIGECFCSLETWPPEEVVPCVIDKENRKATIEFHVQENGKLSNWPAPANFRMFRKYGQAHLTKDDEKWIKAQMENPNGDPLIKNIPYYIEICGVDKDDYIVDEKEFDEFKPAMDFMRALRDNPETEEIHARTKSGWNIDFWRHYTYEWTNPQTGETEECEDEETSFSQIEEWIEEEQIEYIRKFILPDSLDLEIEEMNDMFGDDRNVNEDYSNDLPF